MKHIYECTNMKYGECVGVLRPAGVLHCAKLANINIGSQLGL